MKDQTPFCHKAISAIALLCATMLPNLAAQDSPSSPPAVETGEAGLEKTFDSLGKAAEDFVGSFNRRDAAAISALFTPRGEIVGKDGERWVGRQAIEEYHKNLFAGENVPLIALEASEVELIAPGVAIEKGLVHLTVADNEPVQSMGYAVTHVEQADGSWLMASSRSLPEVSTPAEQIKPLHWLIGEWTLENDEGLRIEMVIDLDERQNYLIGEAEVTDAEQAAQSITLRIGWNPATSSVYWWTFDSEGGNSSGPWSRRGDEWVVHTTGITADAEATASSQTIARDGDTMVWINTERMLAGQAMPDIIYRFARRAPDPISLLEPEPAGKPGDTKPATDGK